MRRRFAIQTLSAALLTAGCAGVAVEEPGATGVVEQALGEIGCTSVTVDDTFADPSGCDVTGSTSPNASYDHGASCPGQYVVSVTGLVSGDLSMDNSGWGDTYPSTELTCLQAHYEIAYYRKILLGSWINTGLAKYHGAWQGGFGCVFFLDTGYTTPNFTYSSGALYRIAGRAYSHFCFNGSCTDTPKKVHLGRIQPC